MDAKSYDRIRKAYFLGIFLLVLYALPKVPLIQEYVYPILNFELLTNTPLISLIAILTGIAAFAAYKYRKIG